MFRVGRERILIPTIFSGFRLGLPDKKGLFKGEIDGWPWKLLLTLRLNYDEYGNHKSVAQPNTRAEQQEKSRMTRDNLKRSIAAALVAAGFLFAARSAQATIGRLSNGHRGILTGAQ